MGTDTWNIISHLWQFMTFNHVLLYKRDTKTAEHLYPIAHLQRANLGSIAKIARYENSGTSPPSHTWLHYIPPNEV